MRSLSIVLFVVLWGVGSLQPAFSEQSDERQSYLEQALNNVRVYFLTVSPVDLAKAQGVLALSGHYRLTVDGKWGPGTEKAFEKMLDTYTAIGGSGPDWGVNSPSDTDRFLDWMDQAAHAHLTGGEFPD